MDAHSPLLGPVIALVAWTLVIMLWMLIARGSEFRRLGIKVSKIPDGARGVDLEGHADPKAQWKSHNYSHLLEQPVLFYAIVFALILLGGDVPINVWIAWGYVGLRVLHSLVQVTVNRVAVRLPLFVLSTLCLIALTLHATMAYLNH